MTTNFRHAIDDVLPSVIDRLRSTDGDLANHVNDRTLAAVKINPQVQKVAVALDQAADQSRSAIHAHGRLGMVHDIANQGAIAEAKREAAVLGFAHALANEMIARTEAAFIASYDESQAMLEADRKARMGDQAPEPEPEPTEELGFESPPKKGKK